MILTGTTHALEIERSSTADVDVICEYTIIDKSGASTVTTPASTQAKYTTAATATLLSAPGANVSYVVTGMVVTNLHSTAPNTITIKKDVSGTEYTWNRITLQAGESAEFVHGEGWTFYNSNGVEKIAAVGNHRHSSVLMAPFFASANLTSTKTITSLSTFAVYLGKAPRSLSTVQARYRVTTAAATITWAEIAIATGPVSVGANPTLTVVGFADVSGIINSTGQKTNSISVSAGQSIDEGDDVWFLIGNSATTAGRVRAQSIADDIQVGVQASLATRPSLNVGTGQAYTIEGATTLAAWAALVI